MKKVCKDCNTEYDISNFFYRNKSKNYTSPYCKKCFMRKNNNYRNKNKNKIKAIKRKEYIKNKDKYISRELYKKYKITLNEYNEMLEKQGNRCFICNVHKDDCSKGLAVDHNHNTGKIRKLLCRQCNSILGYSKENIEILSKCIDYINKDTQLLL